MKPEHLHILRHSLGLDDNGHGNEYRNHYAIGPENDGWQLLQELCELGFMRDNGAQAMWGGMHHFSVTEKGKEQVRSLEPELPKVSRSKRRYLAFLHADCGMKFGDWLKRYGASVTLCLLCVSAGVRQKKPSEILMDLARNTPILAVKPRAIKPVSIIPLPMPAPSRPITRALVARPGITNVSVSWTCATSWLNGEDTRAGLDVRACLTNCLRTGLADATGPVTSLAYAQSNRVTLPASKPSQLFRAFVGPRSQ